MKPVTTALHVAHIIKHQQAMEEQLQHGCLLLVTSAFLKALAADHKDPWHQRGHAPTEFYGLKVVEFDESMAYPPGQPWRIVTATELARGLAVVDMYGLNRL
ncbi:hypothetical protein [Rhizobacter sp. Root404]|uniref:hypothetical protein n=1 Tax=Rhizobacter sp. Root404 TaxID=1736528 RepID=UPI0006FC1263|nr:hypothetical protein [Rhizobacter sp. Root404]KQW36749.1 hypothetical protein ASC76_19120 [Rhizobacter sp. Root404]